MPKRNFDKLLFEAVDEGLSSLGESSKQAIYFHLKKSFNVKKQEIPFKITAFAEGIEKIFGLGANFLETLIVKSLYEKVGESFKGQVSKDLTFTECVAVAKRSFLWKKRSGKTVDEGITFTIVIPIKPKLEGGEKVWVKVPESSLSTTTKA